METMIDAKYTVDDYRKLPEGFPAELLDGSFVKEPAPTWWHQDLSLEIARGLWRTVGRGRVLLSPVDVTIDRHNVLQPDVMVLSEADRILGEGEQSAIPILVVEVLSPATASRDRGRKSATYLRAGVSEVWLVDPRAETVELRTAAKSSCSRGAGTVASEAVAGFSLTPDDLFRPAPGQRA